MTTTAGHAAGSAASVTLADVRADAWLIGPVLLRRLAYASLICLAVAVAATITRPLWRDEYWALFFSDPSVSWSELITDRLNRDQHPPLYFIALHLIRSVIDDPVALRFVSYLALGGLIALGWRAGRRRPPETALFLLLCATSYWAVFYLAELRPYATLYGVVILSVVLICELSECKKGAPGLLAAWTACGAAASLLHYFAALWIAFAGLFLGIAWARRGRWDRFFQIGVATAVAIAPAAAWVAFVHTTATLPGDDGAGFIERLTFGLDQLLRGLLIKTAGSNLALAALAILGAAPLLRRFRAADGVIAAAATAVIAVVFAMHLFWQPSIKERAFIVIMPGVIYLMARAAAAAPQSRTTRRLAAAVPVLAALSPFLFASEHFKDRERFAEVAKVYKGAGDCDGAPVLAYFRTQQHPAYYPLFTRTALVGAHPKGGPELVDAAAPPPDLRFRESCRLRAVAIGLRRGGDPEHEAARQAFRNAGVDLGSLQELKIAGDRHLMYLAPASAGISSRADARVAPVR
jgi:hypothetical protein